MSDLVKRLKTIAKTKRDWHRNLGLRGPDYALSAAIEHQAAAEIERLTAERDAALAKVTQYEQALSRIDLCSASEYAGRVYEYCTCCGACVSEGGKHSDTCIWPVMPDDDINLIARPEVTK